MTQVSLAALFAFVSGCETSASVQVGAYSEFLEDEEIARSFPILRASGAHLNLALTLPADPEVVELLDAAMQEGVRVRIWPLLDREDGYWPNATNLSIFRTELDTVLATLESENVAVDAIVFDLEPPIAYLEEIQATGSDIGALRDLMSEHLDRSSHARAVEELHAMVEWLHERGYRVVAVTFPQLVDDVLDGDEDLADALEIPLTPLLGFDEVAFMVYQTTFAAALGTWPGPALVTSYAEDALAQYSERSAIALGIVGTASAVPISGPLYDSPEQLHEDAFAAIDVGVRRIEIYSLDGIQETDDPAAWLEIERPLETTSPNNAWAMLARTIAATLDETLETDR